MVMTIQIEADPHWTHHYRLPSQEEWNSQSLRYVTKMTWLISLLSLFTTHLLNTRLLDWCNLFLNIDDLRLIAFFNFLHLS